MTRPRRAELPAKGDVVHYRVYRWNGAGYEPVDREAVVIRPWPERNAVRVHTDHDGGKKMTLPARRLVPPGSAAVLEFVDEHLADVQLTDWQRKLLERTSGRWPR